MKIQDKEFSFIKRLTLDKINESEDEGYEKFFLELSADKFKGKAYKDYRKKWRRFCFSFIELPWWRKLFRILPKELTFREVETPEFQEVAVSFFGFVEARTRSRNGQEKPSPMPGPTPSASTPSQGDSSGNISSTSSAEATAPSS